MQLDSMSLNLLDALVADYDESGPANHWLDFESDGIDTSALFEHGLVCRLEVDRQ